MSGGCAEPEGIVVAYEQHPTIMALDIGTSSTRAVLFNEDGKVLDYEQEPLAIKTLPDGTAEQDAVEIWTKSRNVLEKVARRAQRYGYRPVAMGIASQRSTTIIWDKASGKPVFPAISWQDTRWIPGAIEFGDSGDWYQSVPKDTGLSFGAAGVPFHLKYVFDVDPALRARAKAGELLVGSPEAWVLWNLTGGPNGGTFSTSMSSGSSAVPVTLDGAGYYQPLLDAMDLPVELFPTLANDDADFGTTTNNAIGMEIPIRSVIGDQQAALFGSGAFEPGMAKTTHGTGSFVSVNVGSEPVQADKLDMRFGWRTDAGTTYMVETTANVTGSGVDWLVDGLGVLDKPELIDSTYAHGDPESGVVVVPALAGFGAPYWDADARGMIIGLNRSTTKSDVVRGFVDGIAHTVADMLNTIGEKTGVRPTSVAVDGGLSRSDALLQSQADLTDVPVTQPSDSEYATARGAAWLAGIATGVWASPEDARKTLESGRRYEPQITTELRDVRRAQWHDAVNRSLGFKRAEFPKES